MTEGEFEDRIEAAADAFDKHITKKWNASPLFRIGMKSVSMAAEFVLLVGAKGLAERGCQTAAACCFWLGTLGILADIVTFLAFRRK